MHLLIMDFELVRIKQFFSKVALNLVNFNMNGKYTDPDFR